MADEPFECPNCDKVYRWRAKIAGRRVRCVCGQKFRVPMVPGGQAEPEAPVELAEPDTVPLADEPPPQFDQRLDQPGDRPVPASEEPDPYELDLPDDPVESPPPPLSIATGAAAGGYVPGAGGGKCPSCNSPLRPGAVICMNCGFNAAEGAKIQTVVKQDAAEDDNVDTPEPGAASESDERARRVANRYKYDDEIAADMAKRHRFQEQILPLTMIGVGLVLMLFNALVMAPAADAAANWFGVGSASRWQIGLGYVIGSGILMLVQIPCLFVGLILSVKLFGSGFGDLVSVLKKLLALALLVGSFYNMIDLGLNILLAGFGGIGWMFTLSISFFFFWGVIAKLFDELEVQEIMILFFAMLIAPSFILGAIALIFLM